MSGITVKRVGIDGTFLSSTERRGAAREPLLALLFDVFEEDLPPPEVSLREVAARAETSHALLRPNTAPSPSLEVAHEEFVEGAAEISNNDLRGIDKAESSGRCIG
ncbi:hypothetical protein [Mycobacteroides salmoniphilum]|uniref:hypothetical protein n=1 Tax=Mycobacteroides salmoniphilum TaxID=404941 RepID=UPI0010F03C49|nr:hypothetical protein [Mycobacteroides salmoniphilum]TDZ90395.1 hypothetical protein CCUG62472_03646 [Mycobacteroides salmoniphilum]